MKRYRVRRSRVPFFLAILAVVAEVGVLAPPRSIPVRLAAATAVTEYRYSNPPHTGAHGVTIGPDGASWFCLPGSSEIGRLDAQGNSSFYPTPSGGQPEAIAVGADGNLWFTEYGSNRIGRVTPTGAVTDFVAGQYYEQGRPNRIVAGPDGNLWFTYNKTSYDTSFNGDSWIGKATTSGVVTNIQVPTYYAGLVGITVGPDNNIWFAERDAQTLGRIVPATGIVSEYALGTGTAGGPADMTAGPSSTVWFSEPGKNQVASIHTDGTGLQTYALAPGEAAAGLAFDSTGTLWFADNYTSSLGQRTPSGTVTEFATPSPTAGPYGLVVRASDNAVYFTEDYLPAVAFLGTHAMSALRGAIQWDVRLGYMEARWTPPYPLPASYTVSYMSSSGQTGSRTLAGTATEVAFQIGPTQTGTTFVMTVTPSG